MTPSDAYWQGYWSAKSGLPLTDNPYDARKQAVLNLEWKRGWNAGRYV